MFYRRAATILFVPLLAFGFAALFGHVSSDSAAWSRPDGGEPAPALKAGSYQAGNLSVLVNKHLPLSSEYVPDDLTVPDIPFTFEGDHEKKYLRKAAAGAAERLFAAAKKDGVQLYGVSGYRSYKTQRWLWNYNVKKKGEAAASRYNAYPGMSEHQTGLALDVTSENVRFELTEKFGETREGLWLAEHAHLYGFILRYPQGKEDITGYAYEPWHIRYVGEENARTIFLQGITMEEWVQEVTAN